MPRIEHLNDEQKEHVRKLNRRNSKLARMGKPAFVLPHEYAEARAKVIHFHDVLGMSDQQMVDAVNPGRPTGQTATSSTTIRLIRLDERSRGEPRKTMRRHTYEAIMRRLVYVPPADIHHEGARINPVPTQRMMRALVADGFPGRFLAKQLGMPHENWWKIARHDSRRKVRKGTQEDMRRLWEKLSGVRPEDLGVPHASAQRSRALARRYGWAPSHCWDPDTIDRMDVAPEWTGRCGTYQGYRVHRREDIPTCHNCQTADRIYRLWPELSYLMGIASRRGEASYDRRPDRDVK